MADIDTALAASRDAVDQLIRAGEQSGGAWIASRAPGKWSPSQIVEHVARTLEESRTWPPDVRRSFQGRPSLSVRLPASSSSGCCGRQHFRRQKPSRHLILRAGPRRRPKDAFALKRRTRNSMRRVGGLRPTADRSHHSLVRFRHRISFASRKSIRVITASR